MVYLRKVSGRLIKSGQSARWWWWRGFEASFRGPRRWWGGFETTRRGSHRGRGNHRRQLSWHFDWGLLVGRDLSGNQKIRGVIYISKYIIGFIPSKLSIGFMSSLFITKKNFSFSFYYR